MDKDTIDRCIAEDVELIFNNYTNGKLDDCKKYILSLGARYPFALAYVVLELNQRIDSKGFKDWLYKNITMPSRG